MPTNAPNSRTAILDAALEAFRGQGFAGTSIRDLAGRLDITSAALYYHFPNKLAVLETLIEPYVASIEAVLARHPIGETTTLEAKRALLADYLTVLMTRPELSDLLSREAELDAHPDLGPRIQQLIDGMVARLAAPEIADPSSRLRAAAAVGALRRPIMHAEIETADRSEEVLDAAMAALGERARN